MELPSKKDIDRINNMSKEDWQPLLDLIPEIEQTESFGEMKGGKTNEKGPITWPYMVDAPVVSEFQDLAYRMGIIINFDWGSWDEGRAMGRR